MVDKKGMCQNLFTKELVIKEQYFLSTKNDKYNNRALRVF